jgi:peptidoglycan/xylan/chitin deacetylase (PgdA/CDA1 family)
MKRFLKRLALAVPGFERVCRRLTRPHVRAFMYHRFGPLQHGDGTALPSLESHLALVAKHHLVITTDTHVAAVTAGVRLDGCPVVFTVDDGYLDFYESAFPLFSRFRLPVTVFISTAFVGGTAWLWWDRVHYALLSTTASRLVVHLGGAECAFDLSTSDLRDHAWHTICDRCRFMPDQEKQMVIQRTEEKLEVVLPKSPPPGYSAVTWEQVRAMAEGGVLFAPHTVNHPILSRVAPEQVRREVAESRRVVAEQTGSRADVFAYPQGGPADMDDETVAVLKSEGVRGAYVAYQIEWEGQEDPYRLSRYGVEGDLLEFRWRLCGADDLYRRLLVRMGLRQPGVEESEYCSGGRY